MDEQWAKSLACRVAAGDREALKRSIFVSLVLIGLVTLVLTS